MVLDVGTRRIIHWNVTKRPTAAWTIRQFRMTITSGRVHRYLVHERDFALLGFRDVAETRQTAASYIIGMSPGRIRNGIARSR